MNKMQFIKDSYKSLHKSYSMLDILMSAINVSAIGASTVFILITFITLEVNTSWIAIRIYMIFIVCMLLPLIRYYLILGKPND